jgi:propanol-preferring alcohol dehydrogenase
MKALKFMGKGKPPEIVDVPKPEPKAGEVVIKIGGAGVCHSDLHIMVRGSGSKRVSRSGTRTPVGSQI